MRSGVTASAYGAVLAVDMSNGGRTQSPVSGPNSHHRTTKTTPATGGDRACRPEIRGGGAMEVMGMVSSGAQGAMEMMAMISSGRGARFIRGYKRVNKLVFAIKKVVIHHVSLCISHRLVKPTAHRIITNINE